MVWTPLIKSPESLGKPSLAKLSIPSPELKVTETLQPTRTAATGTGLALRALHKVRKAMYQALKRMKPCTSRDGR